MSTGIGTRQTLSYRLIPGYINSRMDTRIDLPQRLRAACTLAARKTRLIWVPAKYDYLLHTMAVSISRAQGIVIATPPST